MNALSLDTHKVVKRLQDAGFSEVQAETVTDVLRESRELDFSNLVTKADLKAVAAELRSEIAELRTELRTEIGSVRTELRSEIGSVRAEIATCKADLLKWFIGIAAAQGGLIVALVRLMMPHTP